jgi:recombination protein RecA
VAERVEQVLKDINAELQKQAIDPFQRLDYKNIGSVPRMSAGAISMDVALGGGYPVGRIVELYGPAGTGKSTFMLHALASAQSRGGIGVFLDTEHALDVSYAQSLGVKVEDLLIYQPDYGEQSLSILNSLTGMLKTGDVIVTDSVAALTPKAELEGDFDDQTPMRLAQLMSRSLSKLKGKISKSGVLALFTNQERATMYGKTTPGGNALRFYASQRIELKSIGKIKQGEVVIGNTTQIIAVKNKVAAPFRKVVTELRFGEGIPLALDLINLGMTTKPQIVETKGTWFSYKGTSLGQGKTNAYKFLQANPEILANIEAEVRGAYGLVF